jgi:hypothetical protein
MQLDQHFIKQVQDGNVVLFLGAGASFGAAMKDGVGPPLGDNLRDLIVEQYLEESYKKDSLSWVADLAIEKAGLGEVQEFVARQYRGLLPATHHMLLPTFRWRGIATTNYDCIIEGAYSKCSKRVQKIVPFLSDRDKVDQSLRGTDSLAYIKLHGCITRTSDPKLPLILTMDQFSAHRSNRTRLFNQLENWGHEYPILFVGYRLQDPNIRQLLDAVSKDGSYRPKYYMLQPNMRSDEIHFWQSKRIEPILGTFENLLTSLDAEISPNARVLPDVALDDHPVCKFFVENRKPPQELVEFLDHDFELVHDNIPVKTDLAQRFYSGFDLGWFPIQTCLDVRRSIVDEIISEVFMRTEEEVGGRVELFAVRAEAGSGKTVLMRRLAWDAAFLADCLCIRSITPYVKNLQSLADLSFLTRRRIFVFVDDASNYLELIRDILTFSKNHKLKVTVVCAERVNEWNIRCESLDDQLTNAYRVPYLNRREIAELVRKLKENDSLGAYLSKKSEDAQVEEFEKRAGRQLLVALHEATSGRRFEDILVDEYTRIAPKEAQRVYLSVCVLNRLKVPVRAGVISRVHGIRFEDFKSRLYAPLEYPDAGCSESDVFRRHASLFATH